MNGSPELGHILIYFLFIYLFTHTTTSSMFAEAINIEVVMTITKNTMEGEGKEQGR